MCMLVPLPTSSPAPSRPGQSSACHPHRSLLTRGTGWDVVGLRLLLLRGPPVAAALLGLPTLGLQALTPTGAHTAFLKLLVVFYL